jgi:hypothetical protein
LEPQTIISGQSATLSWNTTYTDTCTISPDVGTVPASGSVNVAPTDDTTYIITAKGAGGTASTDVHIRVTEPTGPPLVQLEPAETTITSGQDVTLSWASSGADKAYILKDLVGLSWTKPLRGRHVAGHLLS